MTLTEKQIESIRAILHSEGLRNESLTDDLLDHICCVVELLMKRGRGFEEAVDEAIIDIAPHGLIDIEIQTRYLLNSNRIINMKKLMYLMGFLGAATLSVGTLFKIMYWPGADMASLIGVIILLLIFMPLWALDRYKYEVSKALSNKLKFFAGILSALIIGLSVVFKVLHLQGASVLLVVGAFIFVFGYLPFLFFSLYKKSIS
jgi:hypothetical protein